MTILSHQEIRGLLKVGTNGEDLVDQILNADNAILAKRVLDNGIIGESDTLLVDLSVSTLINELTNSLEVRVSISNPRLDDLQHLEGSFGHANEDTIVDLEETKQLEDLARLWCDLVDTTLMLGRLN